MDAEQAAQVIDYMESIITGMVALIGGMSAMLALTVAHLIAGGRR